jgi:glycerol-3-phosphate dehydrogenase
MLNAEGLQGGILYYDGQFDDARMALALAQTAETKGAACANYVEVTGLDFKEGKISAVQLKDSLSGKTFGCKAKTVINATGPFSDTIRRLENPNLPPLLQTSSGSHLIFPRSFSPKEMGLLIPKTEDGRVLFLLPWMAHTLVGTTDNPAPLENDPKASEEDIKYTLRQLSRYFSLKLSEKDILCTWSGLRPLHSGNATTAKLSREHFIEVTPKGLITISGGKWTTYRPMAREAVDTAIEQGNLTATPSATEKIPLYGSENWVLNNWKLLTQEFSIEEATARYLHCAYGSHASELLASAKTSKFKKLHPDHPYLESEIAYLVKKESVRTSLDAVCRRMRLGFLNRSVTLQVLPRVQELMQKALDWDSKELEKDTVRNKTYS